MPVKPKPCVLPPHLADKARVPSPAGHLTARGRLLKDSQIIVEKPMTLDRRRLVEGPLSSLSTAEMSIVERTILAVMGTAHLVN